MLHAKVDNTGIETQRSVVKEEKRQRIDNQPYASFIGEMFKRMFKEHPYNWQPIGSMEHLDAAQEEDYVGFYRTYYVPANATISIAGDINIEQTKKWIDKYFKSIPKGEAINLYRDIETLEAEAFNKKYKRRYKTARKKAKILDCKELNEDFIKNNSETIFKLYETVSDNAGVNSFKLNKAHFYNLKASLKDKFKVYGYFLNEELIGSGVIS